MRKNILTYLEDTAARLPHKLAFSTGKEGYSFGQLQRGAAALGSRLLRDGAEGEAVLIFMDKHPRALASFFGAIYAGCFYVCLDEKMPEARMRTIIDSVSPRFLISDKKNIKKGIDLLSSLRFVIMARLMLLDIPMNLSVEIHSMLFCQTRQWKQTIL